MGGEHTQSHQHLVGMQTWVLGSQILCLRLLNGFDKTLWYQLRLMVDTSKIFRCIKYQRSAAS